MALGQIDLARLQGDALKRWYVRPTVEIEDERERDGAARRVAFFEPEGSVKGEGGGQITRGRRAAAPRPVLRPTDGFISYAFGGPAPITSAGGQVLGYYDHDAASAGLKITAAYAAIAPFFQPSGWADDLIGGAVARATALRVAEDPAKLVVREAKAPTKAPLDEAAKRLLWRQARSKFERVNRLPATELGAQVHHSDPLEWAHFKPDADPNRFANLWPLSPEAHAEATALWGAFRRGLAGRKPTPAELMRMKLKVDRAVAPYLRRPGVSRPGPPTSGTKP